LGGPRNTTVWYGQRVAFGCWRWLDVDIGLEMTVQERYAHMNAKGYGYGKHFMPHDARQTQRNGVTFETDALSAGFKNIQVVNRIPDVWMGIDYVMGLFPSFEFRLPSCERGVKAMKAYESAPDSSSGVVKNVPLGTWAAHVADAVRTMAEADRLGLIPGYNSPEGPRRRQEWQQT
jgi:hypothetical protein